MKTASLPTFSDMASYPNVWVSHALTFKPKSLTGSCSCGRWVMHGFSEAHAIRSHQYHVAMVHDLPPRLGVPLSVATPSRLSTFPAAFIPMRDAMVKAALVHKAFAGMVVEEIVESIENRIESVRGRRPNLQPDQYEREHTPASC